MVSYIVIPALMRQQWVDPWGLLDSQPSLLVKLQVRERPCSKNKVDRISETVLELVVWRLHAYGCTFICSYTHVCVHTPDRTFDFVFAVNRILIPVGIN